jgi:hypothetical protein
VEQSGGRQDVKGRLTGCRLNPYLECVKSYTLLSHLAKKKGSGPPKIGGIIQIAEQEGVRILNGPMPNREDRQIVWLEWLAAASTLGIFAIVLYMVFHYKPV